MKDPIITFSLPRSGSTFLMRLLNKCVDSNGTKVKYNGECDMLHSWADMVATLSEQDNGGAKGPKELKEDKEFLSHYHACDTPEILYELKRIWWVYCGSSKKQWGWKNVNYGIDRQKFQEIIKALIDAYPKCRFIFLDRNHDEVIKSMLKQDYWKLNHAECAQRLKKQSNNYQKVIEKYRDRSFVLPYESLINKDKFTAFLDRLELKITAVDYKTLSENVRKNDKGTLTEVIREKKANQKANNGQETPGHRPLITQ